MTKKLIIAIACLVGLVTPAYAETWKMGVVLIPEKSLSTCTTTAPAKIFWDFKTEGTTFSGTSNQGASFSTVVGAEGLVKVNYTGKLGNDTFPVELTGNVKTKQFETNNTKYSCRYRLVPM